MVVLTYAQAPRAITIGLVFVSIFLLSFVMVGCMHATSAFSSVYLVKFQYNKASPVYENIQEYFNSTNSSNTLGSVVVKTGVTGVCTSMNGETLCTSQNVGTFNRSELFTVANFTIYEGNINHELGSLNLLDLALSFSSTEMYGLILSVLICLGIALVSLVFVAFFPVPPKNWRNTSAYLFLCLALILSVISNLTMYTSANATRTAVEGASMELIDVQIGSKASAMYWVAFVLIVLACALIWPTYKRLEDEVNLEKEKSKLRV